MVTRVDSGSQYPVALNSLGEVICLGCGNHFPVKVGVYARPRAFCSEGCRTTAGRRGGRLTSVQLQERLDAIETRDCVDSRVGGDRRVLRGRRDPQARRVGEERRAADGGRRHDDGWALRFDGTGRRGRTDRRRRRRDRRQLRARRGSRDRRQR